MRTAVSRFEVVVTTWMQSGMSQLAFQLVDQRVQMEREPVRQRVDPVSQQHRCLLGTFLMIINQKCMSFLWYANSSFQPLPGLVTVLAMLQQSLETAFTVPVPPRQEIYREIRARDAKLL